MSFKPDNGATIVASGTTGADGSVTAFTHFTADAPVVVKSGLTIAPASIMADGKETTLVTLTQKDASGNPVTGETVAFEGMLSGLTFGTMTDKGDGTYTATLSGRTVGSVNSLRRNSCTSLVIALFLICAGITGAVVTIIWTLIQDGMLML